MDLQQQLADIFNNTLQLSQEDTTIFPHTANTIAGTVCYKENITVDKTITYSDTKISVSNHSTFAGAKKLQTFTKRVGVLNFANAFVPGGGAPEGAVSQEASLCRASNLYTVLDIASNKKQFYKYHRSVGTDLHSDRVIYSPQVAVFKTDELLPQKLEEPYFVDVLTCAAPNLSRIGMIEPQRLLDLLISRIKNILKVAIKNNIDGLVLGAFGCGVFENPPDIVAKAFIYVLYGKGYQKYFQGIDFAILAQSPRGKENFDIFQKII